MKVKTRNLIEFIMQCGVLVLLFVPGMYQKTYHQLGTSLGRWTSKWTIMVSHWSKGMSISNITAGLLWALIIVGCVGLVLYLIQYRGKKESANLKTCTVFPIVELIIFVISAFFTHTDRGEYGSYKSYYSYSLYIVFFIMIALMVALILLTLIGYRKAYREGFIEASTAEDTATGYAPHLTADELRKYKTLYDDGIITQEEYEEKKQQILSNK
ncbi:MAG: SHOCT domain-containing protein [Clostridiales bacterium]|nr:SHOCT domain-containing protein [Clostridiales bacterium]